MCFLWLEHDHVCCKRKRSKLTSSQIIKRMRKRRRRFLKTEPAACILARSLHFSKIFREILQFFCSQACMNACCTRANMKTMKNIYSNSNDVANMEYSYISFVCDNVLRKRQRHMCIYLYIMHIFKYIYIHGEQGK